MVVRHNATFTKTRNTDPQSNFSVLDDYSKSLLLYPIEMNKIKTYFMPLLKLSLLLFPQIVVSQAIFDYFVNAFNYKAVLFKSTIVVSFVLLFSFISGSLIRYMLDKLDDTHRASYVYVSALSVVHLPFLIIISVLIPYFDGFLLFIIYMMSSYICHANILTGYTFRDTRSSVIFFIMMAADYGLFYVIVFYQIIRSDMNKLFK